MLILQGFSASADVDDDVDDDAVVDVDVNCPETIE